MNIKTSTTHDSFSEYFNNSEQHLVRFFPELYLGSNYSKVIDFWFYIESVTCKNIIRAHYNSLTLEELWTAEIEAFESARTITEHAYFAGLAAQYNPYLPGSLVKYATYELIGNVENPVFVPLFYDL